MLELGISQAQTQFTKILNQVTLIVDKKAHTNRAVILPYEEYEALIKQIKSKEDKPYASSFSKFIGILQSDFKTDDERYKAILK